jgi:hypothetical protein
MVCPAYHSYFILDTRETTKMFSYLGEDSLPKGGWEVDKQKVGIAEEISDRKKEKMMATVSVESIYLPLEDPFAAYAAQYASGDTLNLMDTAAFMSQTFADADAYNIDQVIYLHHFGKYFPQRKSEQEELEEDLKPEEIAAVAEEQEKPKRKFWPFGKGKKNDDADTADEETP